MAERPQPGAVSLEQRLPIRSPGLTPGPLERRAASHPFARPFFLIGSDPLSRQWLARHRDRLAEIGAVGMLVEAETVDDLHAIAALAEGLPILPASASDIAQALGLSHYPVLITQGRLRAMSRHPVEALLRPPVELWSALVAFASAAIAVLAPWALMMPPGVAYAAATALVVLGVVRLRQAGRVLRYQRNLRRLPTYRLRADQIPLSRRKLFLGRGFRWTQKHTQRLRDTIRPEVQRYIQPGRLYEWARRSEIAWEGRPVLGAPRRGAAPPRLVEPAAPAPAGRRQAHPARGGARGAGGVDGAGRAGRASAGARHHPGGQDPARGAADHPG